MASDHFIPQFYLRHFQVPDRQGWLYSYERGKQPKAVAIKSVACEDDYNTLKAKQINVPRNTPDEFLTGGESAAAPILKRLVIAPKLDLSMKEKAILSHFIGYLTVRTPVARERALNIHKAIQMRKMQQFAQNKEEFHNVVLNELKLVATEEEAERHRQLHLDPEKNFRFNLSGDLEDFSLQRAFKSGEFLANILFNKRWVLIQAPKAQRFVTSDNPFLTLVPEPYIPRMEVSAINAECLLPISPQRALLFSNRITRTSIYKLSKNRMSNWVRQLIWFGYEQIFSDTCSQAIQSEFDRVPSGEITKMPLWGIPRLPRG
jgi:hypothetical protein